MLRKKSNASDDDDVKILLVIANSKMKHDMETSTYVLHKLAGFLGPKWKIVAADAKPKTKKRITSAIIKNSSFVLILHDWVDFHGHVGTVKSADKWIDRIYEKVARAGISIEPKSSEDAKLVLSKRYLRIFQENAIPIVPSVFVTRASMETAIKDVFARFPSGEIHLKCGYCSDSEQHTTISSGDATELLDYCNTNLIKADRSIVIAQPQIAPFFEYAFLVRNGVVADHCRADLMPIAQDLINRIFTGNAHFHHVPAICRIDITRYNNEWVINEFELIGAEYLGQHLLPETKASHTPGWDWDAVASLVAETYADLILNRTTATGNVDVDVKRTKVVSKDNKENAKESKRMIVNDVKQKVKPSQPLHEEEEEEKKWLNCEQGVVLFQGRELVAVEHVEMDETILEVFDLTDFMAKQWDEPHASTNITSQRAVAWYDIRSCSAVERFLDKTHKKDPHLLLLGACGGGMLLQLSQKYPMAHFTLVDLSDDAIHIAKSFVFQTIESTHIRYHIQDAFEFVQNASASSFDFCMVDLFEVGVRGEAEPIPLLSNPIFWQHMARITKKPGLIIANFINTVQQVKTRFKPLVGESHPVKRIEVVPCEKTNKKAQNVLIIRRQ